jgi:DNA-nicking Smr family endonuclease
MTRRTITTDERKEFEAAFAETRPLVPKRVDQTRQKEKSGARQIATGGLDGRTAERLRRGLLEPRAKLDLHGCTKDVAHRALLAFLRNAQTRGHRLVLVVTGRGVPKDDEAAFSFDDSRGPRGVLKAAVPRWLNEPEFANIIAGTSAAHRRHGGDGALYIYLRRKAS